MYARKHKYRQIQRNTNTDIDTDTNTNKYRLQKKKDTSRVCMRGSINTDNVSERHQLTRALKSSLFYFFQKPKKLPEEIYSICYIMICFLCSGKTYSIIKFECTSLAAKNFQTCFVMRKLSRKYSTALMLYSC